MKATHYLAFCAIAALGLISCNPANGLDNYYMEPLPDTYDEKYKDYVNYGYLLPTIEDSPCQELTSFINRPRRDLANRDAATTIYDDKSLFQEPSKASISWRPLF